jgi:membrane associated rhomboid family serine protease
MSQNGEPDEELLDPPPRRGRETVLVVLMSVVLGGSLTLFLIFATGGFFGWVIIIAICMSLFGALSFYLWGRRYSRDAAAERQRYEEQEQQSQNWRTATKPPWERRF